MIEVVVVWLVTFKTAQVSHVNWKQSVQQVSI
jgi:hypothetical protein